MKAGNAGANANEPKEQRGEAMDIEAIRKAMMAANITGSGDYITSGKHLLQLVRAKFQSTAIGTQTKNSMIFEFRVHQTTNPEKMPVDSTRSYVDNPANTGFEGRVLGCIVALMGVDPNDLKPEIRAQAVELYCCLLDDSLRLKNGLPENFLANRFVVCEGFDDVSRTNKKPIVKKNWYPAAAPAAPPAAT